MGVIRGKGDHFLEASATDIGVNSSLNGDLRVGRIAEGSEGEEEDEREGDRAGDVQEADGDLRRGDESGEEEGDPAS